MLFSIDNKVYNKVRCSEFLSGQFLLWSLKYCIRTLLNFKLSFLCALYGCGDAAPAPKGRGWGGGRCGRASRPLRRRGRRGF